MQNQTFTREDAISRIKSFNGAVDLGVYDALVNFMVMADYLNAITVESCHGHVNWIFSYPNISFGLKCSHQRRVPFWNLYQRYKKYKNNKRIDLTLEKRVEDIVFFLTREIILFHKNNKTDPRLLFSVIRIKGFSFRIIAAFPEYSRGLRSAGMFEELEQLLIEQREVFKELSEFLLQKVEKISSLCWVDRCDCFFLPNQTLNSLLLMTTE